MLRCRGPERRSWLAPHEIGFGQIRISRNQARSSEQRLRPDALNGKVLPERAPLCATDMHRSRDVLALAEPDKVIRDGQSECHALHPNIVRCPVWPLTSL